MTLRDRLQEDTTAAMRGGSPRQASASAPGHHRHIMGLADLQDGCRLCLVKWKGHHNGNLTIPRQSVTFVGAKGLLINDEAISWNSSLERSQKQSAFGSRHWLTDVGKTKFA